jgi:sugar phosphate isomerase/epimerase
MMWQRVRIWQPRAHSSEDNQKRIERVVKIALGSWAFSFGPLAADPMPFEEVARQLARTGYHGIEVCGFPPHVSLERYPDKESRSALRRQLSDLGLGVAGYLGDFSSVNPCTTGAEDRYLDLFRRNVELCADLGAPFIRVDTVSAPGSIPESDYQPALHRLAGTWRDCADIAREADVLMVWEFEPGFAFNKPSEVLALHEKVGHPWFQVLFDTGHAYMCGVMAARQHGTKETLPGGVPEFLDLLQDRVGAVHLTDSDGTLHGEETSTHCPLGAGQVNFGLIGPKLRRISRVEWWTVDLSFRADVQALLAPSLAFAQRLAAS